LDVFKENGKEKGYNIKKLLDTRKFVRKNKTKF